MMTISLRRNAAAVVAMSLLLVAGRADAAITLIAHAAVSSSDTATATTTGIDTTGATLLAVCVSDDTAQGVPQTLSDSKSNTWTPLTARTSTNTRAHLYYVANPTVGTGHTFTYGVATATFPSIFVAAFSGVATASPFDLENGAGSAGSTTAQSGSITPGQANSILISCLSLTNSRTVAVDSSFTITDQLQFNGTSALGGALAYLVQTSAIAENPTWSWDGTTIENSAEIADFKPTAGGGGGGGATPKALLLLGAGGLRQ